MKYRLAAGSAQPGWLMLALLCGACQRGPAPRPTATDSATAQAVAPQPAALQPAALQPAALRPSALQPEGPLAKDEPSPVRVRAEGQLGPGANTLFIDIAPPEGAKLTLDSPLSVRGSGGIGIVFPRRLSGPLSTHPMPLRLPIDVSDGATGPARVEVTYYWCTDGNEAACRREQAHLDVELDLSGANEGGEAHLSYRARDKS